MDSLLENIAQDDKALEEYCKNYSANIISGEKNIIDLVEELGSLLTNTNPDVRAKGTLVLSNVLDVLPNDLLSATQLNYICSFYTDRLKDNHLVIPPVIKGIRALSRMINIPDGAPTKLLSNIFQEVSCQQEQQPVRLHIYQIFKEFMALKLSELQAMSADLVYGVISAMDSERDPKNLKFLFSWLPTFVKNMELGHLSEEMFEVMACYFPVDFRAPSKDPNQISRDDLAESLTACLCAIPSFGEFCLPLALEKLSSTLRVAKLDSINVLIEGCNTFTDEIFSNHFNEIWSVIQNEIFNPTDDSELQELVLKLLTCVLKKISENKSENGFLKSLSDKISTLKSNLLPNNKLFVPTTKILVGISKASDHCSKLIVSEILPILVDVYKLSNKPDEQQLVFKEIHEISRNTKHSLKDNDLMRKTIVDIVLRITVNENNGLRALGFEAASTTADLLIENERNVLYKSLSLVILRKENESVRRSVLMSFKTLAQLYPSEIKTFLVQLNGIDMGKKLYFDALKELVTLPEFSEYVLETYYNDIKSPNPLQGLEYMEIVMKLYLNNKILEYLYNNNVHDTLQCLCLGVENAEINSKLDVLEHILEIFKICVEIEYFRLKGVNFLQIAENVHAQLQQNKYSSLILLYSILSRTKKLDIYLPNLVQKLSDVICNCGNSYVQTKSTDLLANFINKIEDEVKLEENLIEIENSCSKALDDFVVVNIVGFVTKALLMRGSKHYTIWADKLLSLLDTNGNAANAFKTIMSEEYDCLSQASYCNIRILYRQRFFVEMSKKLNEKYSEEKDYYLSAYGYLMQEVPLNVFRLQFSQVIRLTVLCLDHSKQAETIHSVLEKLHSLLETSDPLMEEHLQEMLPRFMKLAKYQNSMKIRMKALQCLRDFTKGYPLFKLLPHKQDVIYNLVDCLDDPKRLVRKEAVSARSAWFLLDAPI